MPLQVVADNDVLLKGASYALLNHIEDGYGGEGTVGILGVTRYVIPRQLQRHPRIRSRGEAQKRWVEFAAAASHLEPTESEIELSTAIEEAATLEGLALDTGESQLCAIALLRSVPEVITGDKRAIASLELLLPKVEGLADLARRVCCLEQVVSAISALLGGKEVRELVCAEPGVDTAISICFQCTADNVPQDFVPDGLTSYIDDLRKAAPTVLGDEPIFT